MSAARVITLSLLLLGGGPLAAQSPARGNVGVWGSVVLIAGAAVADADVRRALHGADSPALDGLSDVVDPLGRARYIVPAVAGAYIITRLSGNRSWAAAIGRIGLGYIAADAVGSVLKPSVGRHRPDTAGSPWRFRPFSRGSEWHSFPSAHTVHAFALATGIAEEADRGWVSATVYGTATLVGLQRVYTASHWTSDVAATAVLAIVVSRGTNRLLRRIGEEGEATGAGPRMIVLPDRVMVIVPLP